MGRRPGRAGRLQTVADNPITISEGKVNMIEWRLIETAAKDGSRMIVYCPVWGIVTEAHFCNEHKAWFFDNPETIEGLIQPTHWMPLPEPPPKATASESGAS